MKKTVILILSCVAIFAASLCLLFGLMRNVSVSDYKFEKKSETVYDNKERYLETDSFIKMDGKLDEDFWSEQNALQMNVGDYTLSVATKFGEKGIYFGVYTDDENVHANPDREDWQNTGVELHIASAEAKSREEAILLYMTAGGVQLRSCRGTLDEAITAGYEDYWIPFYGVSYVDAKLEDDIISTKQSKGLSFEIIVPWSSVGMSEPGDIICLPAYNHTEGYTEDDGRMRVHYQYQGDMFNVFTWPTFTEKGSTYVPDSETDVIGDAIGGEYKTAGWDLTRRAEGVITSGASVQKIWFKEKAATTYGVETVISNAKPINDEWPSGGIILADDLNGKGICIQLFIGQNGEGNEHWLKIYDINRTEPAIEEIHLGEDSGAKTASGCKLEAIRDGETYYVLVNDRLIYKGTSEYLKKASVAGLYTVGMKADFSKYVYRSNPDIPTGVPVIGKVQGLNIKSAGWDVSQIASKKVSAIGTGFQEICFDKKAAKKYTVEVTVSSAQPKNDEWPSVGLLVGDDGAGNGVRVQLFTGQNGVADAHWFKVYDLNRTDPSLLPLTNAEDQYSGLINLPYKTSVDTADGCRLKIVRNGKEFGFYINNNLVYKGTFDLLANAGVPGFYTVGATAVFSNYTYSTTVETIGDVTISNSTSGGDSSATPTVLKKTDAISGKKIAWLGSSVTLGASANEYSMADIIQDTRENTICYKYAVSGTTLVNNGDTSYVARMKQIDKNLDLDMLIVQLSTNDASQGKALGVVGDSFDINSFDDTTVAGAIEYIIAYAKETWGCPVVFYTGTFYQSTNYMKMVNLLLDIQKKWDIGVIDLWNDAEMTAIFGTAEYKRYMSDNIHPTYLGYKQWWTPKFEAYLLDYWG